MLKGFTGLEGPIETSEPVIMLDYRPRGMQPGYFQAAMAAS